MTRRAGRGISRQRCEGSGGRRLAMHKERVLCLAECLGRVCSGSLDGTIREWRTGTWAGLLTVAAYAADWRQRPLCLAVSGPKLVSGSVFYEYDPDEGAEYEVRVWDLGTLECEQTVRQPAGAEVNCLLSVRGEVWGGVGSEVVVWGRE